MRDGIGFHKLSQRRHVSLCESKMSGMGMPKTTRLLEKNIVGGGGFGHSSSLNG